MSACTTVGGHPQCPPCLALSEREAFFVPLSALGGPLSPPGSPLQRGYLDRLSGPTAAPPCGWGPVPALSQAGGWRGLRGDQGAAAGEAGWRGLTAWDHHPALGGPDLAPRAPPPAPQPSTPSTSPHGWPVGPLSAPNPPNLGPNPAPSRRGREPPSLSLKRPSPDKIPAAGPTEPLL